MRIPPHFTLIPLALLLLCLVATPQAASAWGGKLDVNVVAERTADGKQLAQPTADQPAYCVVYDGGYIEEGDPIAGVEPPAPAVVAQALAHALASQGYRAATVQAAPSLVLIYHWGMLNRDSHQIRSYLNMEPNLKARISLVATQEYARRMEQDIMDRRQPVSLHIPIIDPRERDLLDLVRDDRYFVIVSAYDYAALTHREAKLVWRVKVSTRSAGAALAEALPALLRGGAPYFGRDLDDSQYVRTPVAPGGPVEAGAPKAEEYMPAPEVTRGLDQSYLNGLIQEEHTSFSGIYASDAPAKKGPPAQTPAGGSN